MTLPRLRHGVVSIGLLTLGAVSPAAATNYNTVTHTVGTVNGQVADIYSWYDAAKLPRTLALKQEGGGNTGHGGYAIQMTYVVPGTPNTPVTVNAENSSDGGFGYFVSHERERWFGGNKYASIANYVFGVDDSPLGKGFPVTTTYPTSTSTTVQSMAVRYSQTYHHYGTIVPSVVNPDTGYDQTALTKNKANYKLYALPVTITWVIQALTNYPRIDIRVGLGLVGSADLVNFDMRGPYGVMVFDNGADGTVDNIQWGDQAYQFTPTLTPVIRDSTWDWSVPNTGARYNAMIAGAYEMGLFEPLALSKTKITDGYAAERGTTSAIFGGTSYDSCNVQTAQTMPSDGTWPYQGVQYSLPCPTANTQSAIQTALNTPATFKKIAWGSAPYYGSSLTALYNGQSSFPFNGFPAGKALTYQVCVVVDATISGGLTQYLAGAYTPGNPNKVKSHCAAVAVP